MEKPTPNQNDSSTSGKPTLYDLIKQAVAKKHKDKIPERLSEKGWRWGGDTKIRPRSWYKLRKTRRRMAHHSRCVNIQSAKGR